MSNEDWKHQDETNSDDEDEELLTWETVKYCGGLFLVLIIYMLLVAVFHMN